MEYRILGKTGLRVSLMGFGGIPIQRVSENEAVKITQLAIAKGINFFDSARGYTDSENKIGKGIKGRRNELILATKSMARTYEKMKEDIDKSLKAFDTDYIDLYQCHNVRSDQELNSVLGPDGALLALQEAQKAGKIRHIGLTGHKPPMVEEAIRKGVFETIQVPYNFIERSAEEELLPLARQMELGIIVMKPLAGGAFSRPDLALKFLLNRDVSAIIPGMDSLEQVEQNAGLTEKIEPLEQSDLDCLEKEKNEVGERFCRRCEYCKPCPQGVDITTSFLFHGYFKRYGLPEWARERYQALKVKNDACEECGLCETRCPYNLPIREMLKEVHRDLG